MHWFGKPPIWRWFLVAALVVAAIVVEYDSEAMVMHPFAADDVAPGQAVGEVEWRRVPAGLLPATNLEGVAVAAIAAGEPLLPGSLTGRAPPPADWWSVGMELTYPAAPGTRARVVLADTGLQPETVEGIVVSSIAGDGFSPAQGLIAVPAEHAGPVAAAVQRRAAVVLLAP